MTNEELRQLRAEYTVEYGLVSAWLNFGRPYDGTWIPELVGKTAPQPGTPEYNTLYTLLQPGYLFEIFEQQVLGQHPEYPDLVVDEASGKKRSDELAELMAQHKQQLIEVLGSLS